MAVLNKQWVNSLWPSDVIWPQGSRSTLAQVMACCLMAPSHYLNQCWLIIRKLQWHSFLQEKPQSSVTEISLKITYLKFCSNHPGTNELNPIQFYRPCWLTHLHSWCSVTLINHNPSLLVQLIDLFLLSWQPRWSSRSTLSLQCGDQNNGEITNKNSS